MRLSNKYKIPYISFFYTLLQIILGLSLIVIFVEINKFDVLGEFSWLLIIIPIIIIWLIFILGRPFFEYDSDGEVLVFRNAHIIPLLGKEAKDEFPKYKFIKYNLIRVLFYKKLYIYVSSKKNQVIILKYDLSFLDRKQTAELKYSLNKTMKSNLESNKTDSKNN